MAGTRNDRHSSNAEVLRLLIVGSMIVATLVVWPSPPAAACSCAEVTTGEALAAADVVFSGTVRSRTDPTDPRTSADAALWTVDVDRVFKGDAATTQGVASAMSGASCGLEMRRGMSYVVFAHHEPTPYERGLSGAELYAGLCDGTRPATSEVLAELGAGTTPATGTSGIVDVNPPSLWLWAGAALAALALVAWQCARALRATTR